MSLLAQPQKSRQFAGLPDCWRFNGLITDRMDGNEGIFGKLTSDGESRPLAVEHLLNKVYKAFRKIESQPAAKPGATA